MPSERQIDRLYQLPLDEFTAARNELAKQLRGEGERSAADEVKALAKPSVSAWAVNQIFYAERRSFDRLLAVGDKQRRALARGDSPRAASDDKRVVLGELLKAAEETLDRAGSKWTPALRQRVHRTLEALAAGGVDATPGRLTHDLQPAGFDALLVAAIAPKPSGRARKKARALKPSASRARRQAAARERLRALRAELSKARRKRAAASKALARVESRASDAATKARAAERRAERARQRANELELEARRSRAALERATSAVARAESRLETESRKAEGDG